MKPLFAVLLLAAALVGAGGYTATARASNDVPTLIQQLNDPDVQHRRDAARELSKVVPLQHAGIEAMASLLEKEDQDTLIGIFARTTVCNAGSSAVPIATRFAQSKDKFVSAQGIDLLGCLATQDRDVWPILIGIYKQNPASDAINELAAAGRPALPVLFEALKGDDPTMRVGSIRTIATMVNNARTFSADYFARNHIIMVVPKDLAPAKPQLFAALRDPDPNIRNDAAIALNYADPADKRALPILIKLLVERNVQFIDLAIKGLQASGSLAKPAVPALEHALAAGQDLLIRWDAANALVQIEGQAACAPMESAIVKEDPDWRAPLIRTTLLIDPPCPRIIPTLIRTFQDEYPADSEATAALSRMGSVAVPALAMALKSSNLYVRQNSADALAGMKPLPPDAVRALLAALNDENSEVRDAAITALQTVGGGAQLAAREAEKRDEQARAEKPKPDIRSYSRNQITAPISPDAEYMYPLTLAYAGPITKGTAARAKFFVTVHAGKDRPGLLVFWKIVGKDRYRQETVMRSEEEYLGLDYHFEVPFTFNSAYQRITDGRITQHTGFFVDAPLTGWRMYQDNIFVVDNDRLVPVLIDSPYEGPASGNDFHDGKLEFGENIYNRDDPTCCPTGGQITGTYKIIEDTRQKPAVWKIVVATTKRTLPASGIQPSPKVIRGSERH